MEEEQLVSVTGKEFHIVGPQKGIMNCLILVLQKKVLTERVSHFLLPFIFYQVLCAVYQFFVSFFFPVESWEEYIGE